MSTAATSRSNSAGQRADPIDCRCSRLIWSGCCARRMRLFSSASPSPAVQAAKQATKTIPIVMTNAGDAVATGFVVSIARPEANITGLSMMAGELVGKQLQILKEVVPNLSRVALLWNPTNASNAPQLRHAQEAARTLGVPP